jgi:hypothetical protein
MPLLQRLLLRLNLNLPVINAQPACSGACRPLLDSGRAVANNRIGLVQQRADTQLLLMLPARGGRCGLAIAFYLPGSVKFTAS